MGKQIRLDGAVFEIDAADEQSIAAACARLGCSRDDLIVAVNAVGPGFEALMSHFFGPAPRPLWADPAPDLIQDGQEEVFSHRAVELGLDFDPPAMDPGASR